MGFFDRFRKTPEGAKDWHPEDGKKESPTLIGEQTISGSAMGMEPKTHEISPSSKHVEESTTVRVQTIKTELAEIETKLAALKERMDFAHQATERFGPQRGASQLGIDAGDLIGRRHELKDELRRLSNHVE